MVRGVYPSRRHSATIDLRAALLGLLAFQIFAIRVQESLSIPGIAAFVFLFVFFILLLLLLLHLLFSCNAFNTGT